MVDGADRSGEGSMVGRLATNYTHDYGLDRDGARREPISLTIGIAAISAAEAVSGIAIGFEAASLVGSVAIGGAILGLNYALAKTLPDQGLPSAGASADGPANINSPESRGSIRQAAAPQRRIYGRMKVGGVWNFYDDATPPYQYLQLCLARGRISAVRSVTINGQRIIFDNNTPFDSILDPIRISGQNYHGNLVCCFRQGLDDQAIDPLLNTYFPPSGATPAEIVFDAAGQNVVNLPTTFRQRGIATASFRATYAATQDDQDALWGHVAYIDPLVEVDGHPLFEPRDPLCNINDESTYKFTYNGRDCGRNPSLIQADWLIKPYGGRLRTDQIRLDELAAAADFDDEIVHDRDGNPRVRHQADGVVLLNDNPRQVTEALLTANRSWIVNSRGRVGWVPAKPYDPIITLTEADLRGGFDYQDSAAKRDEFNRIRTRFTPPEKDYTEDDGPVLDRADLRADEDDGELLDTTVRTPFTTDQRAVQWLSGQFLEESRKGRALELPALALSPRLLKCKIGTVVRVQMRRRYTEINGIYQIRKDGYSADFSTLSWSLREYDKAISSDDRSGDQQDFQVAQAA
jgi:hypothetical protein